VVEPAFGGAIARHRPAGEIIAAGIAHVLEDARRDVGDADETGRQSLCKSRQKTRQSDGKGGGYGRADDEIRHEIAPDSGVRESSIGAFR
jgi:hypothetical protein